MFALNPIALGVMTSSKQQTPSSCTITLTGDIGPIAGYAAADVNGQSFGVTDAAANIYLASTDIGNRRPMPPPGKKVWIQVDSFSSSGGFGTNARAGYYAFDANGDPIAFVVVAGNAGGALGVGAISPTGAALANELFPQGFIPYVSLGIDSDGELYFYRADTSEVVALADLQPAFAGVLAGAESIVLLGMCDLSGGGPASAGARFVTDQSEMLDAAHLGGDLDWCGNALPEPAPIGCSITLSPDGYTSLGFNPANVDGQTVSVTNAQDTAVSYAAGTPLASPRPKGSGIVVVEARNFEFVNEQAGQADLIILDPTTLNGISIGVGGAGQEFVFITQVVAGEPDVNNRVSHTYSGQRLAVGVDQDTGTVKAWVGGVQIVQGFLAPGGTGEGFLVSATGYVVAGFLAVDTTGADMSFEVVTDGTEFISNYGGALDWCGNEIPAPPAPDLVTPDTIATEGVDVFYFNPSLPGTLWADRDGTTPAGSTVGSPVLRMDNLSSRTSENMVAPLDRSGFERSSPDRLRKIDNFGILALDSEFSEVEGITVALDVTTATDNSQFFGGGVDSTANQLRIYRSGSAIIVAVHGTGHNFPNAIVSGSQRRLIATITQDTVSLYVNGVLHGSLPLAGVGGPFTHICLGAAYKSSAHSTNATWGRAAVLKEALDETRVEKLDKWLALGDYSEEPVTVTATFDPVKTHSAITLSDGNRRANCTSASANYWTQLQPAKSSGKWFVEYLVHTATSSMLLGVTHEIDRVPDATINPYAYGGIAGFFWNSGRRLYRDTAYQSMGGGDIFNTLVAGDRITVAYDIDNLLFYLYRNGIPAADNPFPLDFEPAGPNVVPMLRMLNVSEVEIVTNPKWPIPGFQPWGG